MARNIAFFGGHSFRVDETEFVSAYGTSTLESFCVMKTDAQLEFFLDLCRRFESGSILEIGVASGGSTALLALVAKPRRLVVVEVNETPVRALQELIEARGLQSSVRPVYGVDQADRERLLEIVEAEFGDHPLDLVIDDASHLRAETTASFETLFPLLRPGGLYVIEDWNSWHLAADGLGGSEKDGQALPTPLSPLLMELLLARASSAEVVAQIVIGDLWATIERGPAEIDPRGFRVRDLYQDHFGLTSPTWQIS